MPRLQMKTAFLLTWIALYACPANGPAWADPANDLSRMEHSALEQRERVSEEVLHVLSQEEFQPRTERRSLSEKLWLQFQDKLLGWWKKISDYLNSLTDRAGKYESLPAWLSHTLEILFYLSKYVLLLFFGIVVITLSKFLAARLISRRFKRVPQNVARRSDSAGAISALETLRQLAERQDVDAALELLRNELRIELMGHTLNSADTDRQLLQHSNSNNATRPYQIFCSIAQLFERRAFALSPITYEDIRSDLEDFVEYRQKAA